jgi:hypothetical protein
MKAGARLVFQLQKIAFVRTPKNMPSNQSKQSKSTLSVVVSVIVLFFGLALIGGAWWISNSPAPETESQIQARQEAEKVLQIEALRQRRELLSRQIELLVDTEQRANQVAILRAQNSLDDAFISFSNRVPEFVEAVTTWKARYQIARSGINDKVSGSHEMETVAAEYFEKNVASNQDVSSAIDKIVAQFQSDLVANRNRMLSEAALRIREADLGLPPASYTSESLGNLVTARQEQMAQSLGGVPVISVLSISGSIIVEMALQTLVTRALSYAAGATTTGALTGAGAGTLITPGVGTAIGIMVGFAGGFAVDQLMTERMKAKIMRETKDSLESMKNEIWMNSTEGLNTKLSGLVKQTKELHVAALTSIAQQGKT